MAITIVSALGAVFAPVANYLKAVRTERVLSSLSDTVLRDIGIERAQIASISRSAAERNISSVTALGSTLVVLPTDKPATQNLPDAKLAA